MEAGASLVLCTPEGCLGTLPYAGSSDCFGSGVACISHLLYHYG